MDRNISPIKSVVAYTSAPWNHALAVLRIVAPLRNAGITPIHGNPGGQIDPEKVSKADLILIQRDFPNHIREYEEILSRARAQSKPFVLDLDDWLLELPEDHPDRINHHYAGGLFPMLRAIMEADAVTVSTTQLAERINSMNDMVRVLPNYIDDELWDVQLKPGRGEPQQTITLVYMGGDSHAPDFEPLIPVLVEILQTYGESIAFRSIGMKLVPSLQSLPNVEAIPFKFAYTTYTQFVRGQHFDLAIAPLGDNPFNHCKSSMKYLEYSALGLPGVYSRITPYASQITDGVNGFLASSPDEWREKICRLIEDSQLRQEVGAAAQDSVRRHWLLRDHAQEWVEAYDMAATQTKREKKYATLPISLFANLTRQNRQWEKELEARLGKMQQVASNSRGDSIAGGDNSASNPERTTASRSGLPGMLNRGLQWISSLLSLKTNRWN